MLWLESFDRFTCIVLLIGDMMFCWWSCNSHLCAPPLSGEQSVVLPFLSRLFKVARCLTGGFVAPADQMALLALTENLTAVIVNASELIIAGSFVNCCRLRKPLRISTFNCQAGGKGREKKMVLRAVNLAGGDGRPVHCWFVPCVSWWDSAILHVITDFTPCQCDASWQETPILFHGDCCFAWWSFSAFQQRLF